MKTPHAVLVCALLTAAATAQPLIDLEHTVSPGYRVNGELLNVEQAAAIIRDGMKSARTEPSTTVTFRCSPKAPIRWVEKALADLAGATAGDSRGGLPVTQVHLLVAGLGDPIRISVLEDRGANCCVYLRQSPRVKNLIQVSMDPRFKSRDATMLRAGPNGEIATKRGTGFPAFDAHLKRSNRNLERPVFISTSGDVPVAAMLPIARHLASSHGQPVAFETVAWRAETTYAAHLLALDRAATSRRASVPTTLQGKGVFGTRKSSRMIGTSQILAAQKWLAVNQQQDGTWSDGPGTDPIELTGLALLAYVEPHLAGSRTRMSHRFGRNSAAVGSGLEALMACQDASGRFGDGPALGHAVATVAMIQAHKYSGSGVLKLRAQRAWNALCQILADERVFRQEPRITGWAMLAVLAAEHAGLEVDSRSRADILSATQDGRGKRAHGKRARGRSKRRGGATEVAGGSVEAMEFAAQICLPPEEQESMHRKTSLLAQQPPRWASRSVESERNYFNTYLLFSVEGPTWRSWRAYARNALMPALDASTLPTTGSDNAVASHERGHSEVRAVALAAMMLKLCGRDRRFYPPELTKRKR